MLALQQSSSVKSNVTGISSPVKKLLDAYDKLDDTSRQALWNSALATNNTDLQRALFSLRNQSQNLNNTTTQAKLAKELIKLAETYKVPELKFDEQAK